MAVTEEERDYLRRIGEYKAESHARAQHDHMALSMEERLKRSMLLYRRFAVRERPDQRDDDPRQFYDRARRLGLYQPRRTS